MVEIVTPFWSYNEKIKKPAHPDLNRQNQFTSTMKALWVMSEGSGNNTLEYIGGDFDNLGSGMAWGRDKYGPELTYNGTAGMAYSDPFGSISEVTFGLLIRANSNASEYRTAYNQTGKGFFILRLNEGASDEIQWYVYDGAANTIVTTAYSVTEYHLIIGTAIDNGNMALYVDGTLINTAAIGSFTAVITDGQYIGAARDDTLALDGSIALAFVCDTAWTENQVSEFSKDPFSFVRPRPLNFSSVTRADPVVPIDLEFSGLKLKPRGNARNTWDRLQYGLTSAFAINESSGNVLIDSARRNNGIFGATTAAPTWITSPYGSALSFDSSNSQLVTFANSVNYAWVTIGCLVRTTSTTLHQTFLSLGNSGDDNFFAYLRMNTDPAGEVHFSYRVYSGGPSVTITATSALSTYNDGNWHTIVGVRDTQTTAKLYIDGIEVGSGTDAGADAINIQIDQGAIGCLHRSSNSSFFDGDVALAFASFDKWTPERVAEHAEDPFSFWRQPALLIADSGTPGDPVAPVPV